VDGSDQGYLGLGLDHTITPYKASGPAFSQSPR
jgi:hypothetical protein